MEFTGIVRHVAQFVAGLLVARGKLDATQVETLVGVIVGLATLGWYYAEKKKA